MKVGLLAARLEMQSDLTKVEKLVERKVEKKVGRSAGMMAGMMADSSVEPKELMMASMLAVR